MPILFGSLTGLLGFVPLFLAFRLARKHPSTNTLTFGLFGLGGVFVSLIILVVGLIICAMTARDGLVGFAIAEAVVFLGATIAFVLKRNYVFKRGGDKNETRVKGE